jgi:nucleotide-binding universal stress UspA family protein
MYKTILVPLDGSKRAERILPHVERLAMHYNAALIFLQVVEPPPLIVGPEGDMTLHQQDIERWVKEAEDYLAAAKGKFQQKGIETRTHVAHGPVVEAIITAAEREEADLVAIASHGRSGLSQVFYGSIAAGVLHRIDRPLLLIRSQGEE